MVLTCPISIIPSWESWYLNQQSGSHWRGLRVPSKQLSWRIITGLPQWFPGRRHSQGCLYLTELPSKTGFSLGGMSVKNNQRQLLSIRAAWGSGNSFNKWGKKQANQKALKLKLKNKPLCSGCNCWFKETEGFESSGAHECNRHTKTFMHDQERPEMVLNSPLNLRLHK